MSEKYEGISSYDAASYMDLALAMAQVIHTDLTVANVRLVVILDHMRTRTLEPEEPLLPHTPQSHRRRLWRTDRRRHLYGFKEPLGAWQLQQVYPSRLQTHKRNARTTRQRLPCICIRFTGKRQACSCVCQPKERVSKGGQHHNRGRNPVERRAIRHFRGT